MPSLSFTAIFLVAQTLPLMMVTAAAAHQHQQLEISSHPPMFRIGEQVADALKQEYDNRRKLQPQNTENWPECDALFYAAKDIATAIYNVEMDCLCLSGSPSRRMTCTTTREVCCGTHCGMATHSLEFNVLKEVMPDNLQITNLDLVPYEEVCFTYSEDPEGGRFQEPATRCIDFYACTPQIDWVDNHEVQCTCEATWNDESCGRCSVCTQDPTPGATDPIFAAVSDCRNVDPESPVMATCSDLQSMQQVSAASYMYCLPAGEQGSTEYNGGLLNGKSGGARTDYSVGFFMSQLLLVVTMTNILWRHL